MTFRLSFRAYNGMTFPLGDGLSELEGRDDAAKYLTDALEDHCEVSVLDKGKRWEIQTQSNVQGICITDKDGILELEAEPEPEYDEDEDWWDDAA